MENCKKTCPRCQSLVDSLGPSSDEQSVHTLVDSPGDDDWMCDYQYEMAKKAFANSKAGSPSPSREKETSNWADSGQERPMDSGGQEPADREAKKKAQQRLHSTVIINIYM